MKTFFKKILLLILYCIREIYVYSFLAIDNSIKYNLIFLNWIYKLKSDIIFLLFKIISNLIFFKWLYFISKIIFFINFLIFLFILDINKSISYLKKLWILLFLFFLKYYPKITFTVIIWYIVIYIFDFIKIFLNYKHFKNNSKEIFYKILCVWDDKIVAQSKCLQTEIISSIKDINILLKK